MDEKGLSAPRRYWAMFTMAVSLLLAVLDGAAVNVALPTIAHDFGIGAADSIRVVNAYLLAVVVLLFPLSSLAEIVGCRRVYLGGLAVFTLASLACATADSLTTLTVARVFQGFGAAGTMSVNLAFLRYIFPPERLGRGVGFYALIVATASAAGPTAGAFVLSLASWHWLFAINVPLGLTALIAARSLPDTPRASRPYDLVSAGLNVLTFGLLIDGLKDLGDHGAARPLLEVAAALLCGALLVRRQRARAAPMLPVDLLRLPIFALSVTASVCSFAAQSLAFVSLPFYLQHGLGRTAMESGLLITPWPAAVALVAPFAGRLADRHDAGVLGGIGLALFSAGLAAVALLPDQPTVADIAWRMVLCGLGFGLFQSPNNRVMATSAPRERSGGASGIQATARLLGQTTGAALAAVVFGLAGAVGAPGTGITVGLASALAAVACVASLLRRPTGTTAENT
ncbi:MFS transporter [Azospirillum palustre]|uniref:MFS transporter n=1 Tax=Azospirillum palustre TaxID=2044885 RepID=A0A2B8BP35_9PROT|nr:MULTISPECIES: MFS transporter [Azospirillum]MDR6775564.1 DHA2 family multidrug resistance protein-like MFS transporter [Azospirillum sp. BE72]PGH58997.1 MFS transporter [Azospirillum palustre]